MTQIMPGAAVAAILAPIAIQTAQQAGLNPRSLAMAVALATSMAFMTPLGHPVNILVMGLGGYRFRDFLRVGLPLTALLFGVVMILLPVFWPLATK
jgi:di/tricarboxylate transporter